jgi:hypothetical protein
MFRRLSNGEPSISGLSGNHPWSSGSLPEHRGALQTFFLRRIQAKMQRIWCRKCSGG